MGFCCVNSPHLLRGRGDLAGLPAHGEPTAPWLLPCWGACCSVVKKRSLHCGGGWGAVSEGAPHFVLRRCSSALPHGWGSLAGLCLPDGRRAGHARGGLLLPCALGEDPRGRLLGCGTVLASCSHQAACSAMHSAGQNSLPCAL